MFFNVYSIYEIDIKIFSANRTITDRHKQKPNKYKKIKQTEIKLRGYKDINIFKGTQKGRNEH